MRRIIFIVCAGLIVAGVVATEVVAPRLIRRKVIALIEENCGSCTFTLPRVGISLLPVSVSLEAPQLVWGEPHYTRVDAQAGRILARISLLKLLRRQLYFRQVEIEAPKVVVTEGDLRFPPSEPREAAPPSRWTYVSQGVKLNAGKFRYVRLRQPQNAIIRVSDIEGNVGPWGTTPDLHGQETRAHAKGRLEDSGSFTLSITMPVPSKPLHVDIELEIAGQNLSDINSFFEFDDGIKLRGTLVQGRGLTAIRGTKLKASVEAKYLGLGIEFEKTKERSAIAAFFSNLIQSIKIDPSSIGEKPSDQVRSVEIECEPGETIMQFILRGMKDAALKVASSSHS